MTPPRTDEDQNQVHKGKEQLFLWSLMGVNITAASVATAFLMDPNGPRIQSFLPDLFPRQEFLLLGGAPALLSHLLSGVLLTIYYRCSHTWREIGSDINCRRCCCCCYCCCCPSIGRLCSQKNPITGEIPFWEKVRDRELRFCFEYEFSGGEERGQPGSDGDITTCNKGEIPFLQKDQRTKSFR